MSVLSHRSFVTGVAALSFLVSGALVFAQQPLPQQPVIQPAPATQVVPGQAVPVEQQARGLSDEVTKLLIAANRDEIALSRFGQDRAQSQQVRDFAQRMVKEHQDFIAKLQQASGAATPAAPGVAPAADGQRDQLVQMLQRVGDRQVQLTKQELANRQGIEFDQAFMGTEVAGHIAMLAALETAANQTTGQLQQVISQGVETTRTHLNQAQGIMQQLEQQAAQQAGKPQETQQR